MNASEIKDESFYHATRPIPGFVGYRIDPAGNVYSCLSRAPGDTLSISPKWRRIKPKIVHAGYLQVGLVPARNRVTWKSVARLVLLSWVGPCPPGYQCCHNDGNKLNNTVANLRWDTQSGNYQDRFKHGTSAWGIHRRKKLHPEDVIEIRRLRKSGMKMPKIAAQFGLDKSTVRSIVIGEHWGYLKDDGTVTT